MLHASSEWSGQCDQCKYVQKTWLVSIQSCWSVIGLLASFMVPP